MLPSYFDYIFVHLKQTVRLRPRTKPEIFVKFRPELDPKSLARLTTLATVRGMLIEQNFKLGGRDPLAVYVLLQLVVFMTKQ